MSVLYGYSKGVPWALSCSVVGPAGEEQVVSQFHNSVPDFCCSFLQLGGKGSASPHLFGISPYFPLPKHVSLCYSGLGVKQTVFETQGCCLLGVIRRTPYFALFELDLASCEGRVISSTYRVHVHVVSARDRMLTGILYFALKLATGAQC